MKRIQFALALVVFIVAAGIPGFWACSGDTEDEGKTYEHTTGCETMCLQLSECNDLGFFKEFDDVQDCTNDCWEYYDSEILCMIDCDTERQGCDEFTDCVADCL
jgi:hypothetical protein